MIYQGDWLKVLKTLESQSFQTCVTSPPYWGLRDYGVEGQLGLEPTLKEYVAKLVSGFREVRRVLRDDGTLWLVLGDCYIGSNKGAGQEKSRSEAKQMTNKGSIGVPVQNWSDVGLKPKDLAGVPWRVALALQADGWWLRNDIIYAKTTCLPESVRDRCTLSHEYIFLLAKSAQYFYDQDAIREPLAESTIKRVKYGSSSGKYGSSGKAGDALKMGAGASGGGYSRVRRTGGKMSELYNFDGRNKRSVWQIARGSIHGAHFAVFPEALVEPCILAGTSAKGQCPRCGMPWERDDTGWMPPTCDCDAGEPVPQVVLDPFAGAGTTGVVAKKLGRDFVGIELNPDYVEMAERRISKTQPALFSAV